jgi:hypothetical protein
MVADQRHRIMNQDFAQRRRVALALAITVIAVPAAFLLNRNNEASTAPTVTVIGTVPGQQSNVGTPDDVSDDTSDAANAPSATDAMGTTAVGFLDGTVPGRDSDPATIAIPRLPQSINGIGTFTRDITNVAGCMAKDAPFSARITVTNRDNSRSVLCINNIGGVQSDADVVLHADAFVQIADLTDAPISVQITW